eukprot:CAMPEP_0197034490 /NCGR_PEP_ID=MMETSP1384-20130603/12596_1 /TAXON_ID=29189 /ORGANISM="Ammonia sp." /LENGTH=494 /DNA_ID=CAMNT_0042464431 /DNA_START=13 /DNA_END=1494 /DNA_ORIENTATION=-
MGNKHSTKNADKSSKVKVEEKPQKEPNDPPAKEAKEAPKDESHEAKHAKAVEYGLQVMQNGFVKVDHFENIYRIEPKFEGSPNLRQVQGFQIYGTGQPNKSSIERLLNIWFNDMKLTKCLWVNMRTEPVIYVQDISLAPRDPKHPSENIDFGEDGIISIDDIHLFNAELEKVVKKNIEENKNVFVYHKDTYAPLPADRKDMVLECEVANGANDVYGLESLYKDELATKQKLNIELQRITVLDEKAPEPEQIDKIVDVVSTRTDAQTVIVFNCQMGKGRTTEGMIMACLIKLTQQKLVNADDSEEANGDGDAEALWPNGIPADSSEWLSFQRMLEREKKENEDEEAADPKQETDENKEGLSAEEMKEGNFTLIKKLVDILTDEYGLDGKRIKLDTDDIINRCQHLTNMRECIYLAKLRYIHEKRENERGYWQKMAKQFLQRYYVLIVFNAYLNDVLLKQKKTLNEVSYTQWIATKPAINENLGTLKQGDLSQFDW